MGSTSINRRHFTLSLGAGWAGWAEATDPAGLLVVGDSLSAEYGLSRGTGWVALLGQRLRDEQRPWRVINASISGETTAGGRNRLPPLIEQHRPRVVVIELGGNDALRGLPLASTRQNLQAMIDQCVQARARVLLVSMQVPPNYGPDYNREFLAMYQQLARANRLSGVPFLLQGLTDAKPETWFQPDRIHPNAQAQPRMLDNVWPELKKLL